MGHRADRRGARGAPDAGHGRWLPWWVKRASVCVWNFMACRVVGHEWFDDIDGVYCANCSKELKCE